MPSYLDFLEDDNLFKIHMAEEDEQNMKKIMEATMDKENEMRKKVADVIQSNENLEIQQEVLYTRYRYLAA